MLRLSERLADALLEHLHILLIVFITNDHLIFKTFTILFVHGVWQDL